MCCCDTGALLISPRNKSNAMYYRTKLNIHNLMFYDQKTHEVLNYLWNEVDGQIECDNLISTHVDYFKNQIVSHSTINEVIIWSDGCNYQNRCKELSNALLFLAVHFKVTILRKYLEVGHTHMECDSVHSKIDSRLKSTDINVPSDYVSLIESARKKRGKYKMKVLDFTFFKDYKDVTT